MLEDVKKSEEIKEEKVEGHQPDKDSKDLNNPPNSGSGLKEPPKVEEQPDTIIIKAFPDHRLQVSYEFKGKDPRQQKSIAHSILENTATGLFKELLLEELQARVMHQIEENMKPPSKIITPENFVVPGLGENK